jgi:hypothetical protein
VRSVRIRDGTTVDVRPIELHELAERAREEGVTRFTAYVLARNEHMIDMLFRVGPAPVADSRQ